MARFTVMFSLLVVVAVVVIAFVVIAGIMIAVRLFIGKGASPVIQSCPSRERWREWLDSRLNDAERADYAVHLEGCLHCQQTLDELARASGQAWTDYAREAFRASPPEPELARVMDELKHRPPAATVDSSQSSPRLSDGSEFRGNLNGYEVLSEIGRGGMGVVLRAFDPKLRRVVAIKVLAPHLAANAAARERFLREARAAAAVAHEHVVTIHSVEESSAGTPYIVMQFVPGRSLQERLDQTGPMKLTEVLRIGVQAASGLAAAHAQGLIHRDIKPANILLENGIERVKLADFGLARATDDASLTRSGVITGSPQFMSPEQARGETVDFRSDLFGLGCVLYAMCAGHPPFRAPTPLAVLKRVCDDTPRSLREINSDVPDWLEAIVFKLLAKDPADRFESAAEVADLLGQHLRHLQHADAPLPPPVTVRGSNRPQRSPEIAAPASPGASKGSGRIVVVILACVAGALLLCCGLPVMVLMLFWASTDVSPGGQTVVRAASPAVTEGRDFRFVQPMRGTEKTGRSTMRQRGLIEILSDPKAEEFNAMRGLFTFDSVQYDPKTRTVSWNGLTTSKDFKQIEAQVNIERFTAPIRFFGKDGHLIGTAKFNVELGRREPDGRYMVFFKLLLTEEIVKNATSFEFHER